ncbi:hypothetical protein RclHR1_13630003 [Rhizophagus clarus]|uniref:Uncharacterized protein n=1 Tax=Rhizophagus clarus TaxID=94130 RepID=A0A2Z6QAJ9_9GLOM|nr:hypothetical protein RclHR1_13630003 [Rhizophagus clarus]
MNEKVFLTSPTIPEDPMEDVEKDVENTLNQETTCLIYTKCSEKITADFPKILSFCPVNMLCIMIALTIHTKCALPAQLKIWNCFQ